MYRLALAGSQARAFVSGWRLNAPAEAGEAALAKVRGCFARLAWPAAWLGWMNGELAGACLVERWPVVHAPLIGCVMTAARWKGRGVARALLKASLRRW